METRSSETQDNRTWVTVTPELALGGRLRETMVFSNAANIVCSAQKNPRKGIELIGQEPCDSVKFLTMPGNSDILKRVEDGIVFDAVKVARVTDPTHPAVVVANLCTETKQPGFTLYVSEDIPKGTILGSLVGEVLLGKESDTSIRNEQEGSGKLREASLVDLEGSLKSYGGWVVGDRTEENANMLVLDPSKGSNVLCLLADNRSDPLNPLIEEKVRGAANIKLVQLRVSNLPLIVAVATIDIVKDTELMIDIGKNSREAVRNIFNSAKHLHDLQRMVNELTDRNQQLHDDYNTVISKQVKDNKNVTSARNAALHMVKEWREMVEDDTGDSVLNLDTSFPHTILVRYAVRCMRLSMRMRWMMKSSLNYFQNISRLYMIMISSPKSQRRLNVMAPRRQSGLTTPTARKL